VAGLCLKAQSFCSTKNVQRPTHEHEHEHDNINMMSFRVTRMSSDGGSGGGDADERDPSAAKAESSAPLPLALEEVRASTSASSDGTAESSSFEASDRRSDGAVVPGASVDDEPTDAGDHTVPVVEDDGPAPPSERESVGSSSSEDDEGSTASEAADAAAPPPARADDEADSSEDDEGCGDFIRLVGSGESAHENAGSEGDCSSSNNRSSNNISNISSSSSNDNHSKGYDTPSPKEGADKTSPEPSPLTSTAKSPHPSTDPALKLPPEDGLLPAPPVALDDDGDDDDDDNGDDNDNDDENDDNNDTNDERNDMEDAEAAFEAQKLPPVVLPASRRRSSAGRVRSRVSDASVASSSRWDGEFALSVLNASVTSSANALASASRRPPSVGAFAASADDEARRKKEKEEAKIRRCSSSSTAREASTFDDRLRRKLADSRGNSDEDAHALRRGSTSSRANSEDALPHRRGSQVSFALSVGSASGLESVDEGTGRRGSSRDFVGRVVEAEGREDAQSSPGAFPSSPKDGGQGGRRGSESYRKGRGAPPHRRTSDALTAEEYEEFVQRKLSSQGELGMTYAGRKRREEEEAAAAAFRSISTGNGLDTNEKMNEGALQTTDVDCAGRGGPSFYQPVLMDRDHEEEKAELSADDCAVATKGNGIIDAVCHATTAAAMDSGEEKEVISLKDSFTRTGISSLDLLPGKSKLSSETSRCSSPFSNMAAGMKKVERAEGKLNREAMKVVTQDRLVFPEDIVEVSDQAPRRISDPEQQTQRRSGRLRTTNNLNGSFTEVVDRLRGSGTRARSMNELEEGANADAREGEVARRSASMYESVGELGEVNMDRTLALRQLADMVSAQGCVQATLVPEERPVETVTAIPMDEDEVDFEREEKLRRRRRLWVLLWCPLVLLVLIIAVAISVVETKSNDSTGGADEEGDVSDNDGGAHTQEIVHEPTLTKVHREGVLRCGITQKYGFSFFAADFCRAVAAGVLGPNYEVDLVNVTSTTRFVKLASGQIDLLAYGDTHTMERDFHEKATGVGFQFTDPYFYDGVGFAGLPNAVGCADSYDWRGDDCRDLRICVTAGTTHVDILKEIFPQQNLILASNEDFIPEFVKGSCSVIAGEQNEISELVVRKGGYKGEFMVGKKSLSKEPLALVTRKNDQSWTDTANWIVRILVHSEMAGIVQADADKLSHDVKVDVGIPVSLEIDFVSAVSAVGNYGEIYARNMEEVVPRKGLNLLYALSKNPNSGLFYSHPAGVIDIFRHSFKPNGIINQIRERGTLTCGVIGNPNQSMESDYCRALSASLFESDSRNVDFVELSNNDDLLLLLDSGDVDVVAGAVYDYHSDIVPSNRTESGLSGLAFSRPFFHEATQSNIFQG
ncbi:hypothetical protein ACHAWF_013366, partial [Thalassiosira exigua]